MQLVVITLHLKVGEKKYEMIHEYTKSILCNNEILCNAVSCNVKGLAVVHIILIMWLWCNASVVCHMLTCLE